jgi:transcription elongation GreA/GreB family factor
MIKDPVYFKSGLVAVLQNEVNKKQAFMENALAKLNDNSDTKSAAGDKYETGVEMVKQEQNKIMGQLNEIIKMNTFLQKVSFEIHSSVRVGSVIVLPHITLLLSVAFGKLNFQNHDVLCVSHQAPLAKLLIGKKPGDPIEFNGKQLKIIQTF